MVFSSRALSIFFFAAVVLSAVEFYEANFSIIINDVTPFVWVQHAKLQPQKS